MARVVAAKLGESVQSTANGLERGFNCEMDRNIGRRVFKHNWRAASGIEQFIKKIAHEMTAAGYPCTELLEESTGCLRTTLLVDAILHVPIARS